MACNFDLRVVEFLMSDTAYRLYSQIGGVSSTVGTYAAGIAVSGCALYGVMWAVAFASGAQNGDVVSFFKWLAKALILITLAGTAAVYAEFVTDTFWTVPAEIGQYVVKGGMGQGLQMDAEGRLTLGTALDQAASRGVCAATSLWKETSAWSPVDSVGYFLAGLVVIIGVILFVGIAAGLVMVGLSSLAIVLALGPLFIICGIWDATRPMFESFLRTALNYSLYGLVVMVVAGLAIGLVEAFGQSELAIAADGDLGSILLVAIRSLFAFAVATALLFKADDISASLVGGISLGAAGLAGRAASMATSPAKAAMSAAKIATNPGKAAGEFLGGNFHQDPRTGRIGYRGPIETAGQNISAVLNARKRNNSGIKKD